MPDGTTLDEASVLGRAMLLLRSFGPEDRTLTLAELVHRTRLPKATTHRIAGDLVTAELLDRDGSAYRLGASLFQLGMRAARERTLVDAAIPFLRDLYERTHEIVHLGVRSKLEVVYVAKLGGHRQVDAPSRVGGHMPLYCTAIGKTLLAHAGGDVVAAVIRHGLERRAPRTITSAVVLRDQLSEVAKQGVAFEYEESAVGLVCVAAPVMDTNGSVVAALSVTGPPQRFAPARHRNEVRIAALGISGVLANDAVSHSVEPIRGRRSLSPATLTPNQEGDR